MRNLLSIVAEPRSFIPCVLLILLLPFSTPALCQQSAPLKQVGALQFPPEVKGHFDHVGIDLKGNRLFSTPEDYKAVLVFDLKGEKLIHNIGPIGRPHAVLYRQDLDRIYVTDGGEGALKIFDGKSYKLLQTVKLLVDADSIGYDPSTHYLYIDNGGGDAHQTYSMLSVVDTTAGKKLADIKIDGDTLEAMALEQSSPKLYLNNKAKNQVEVVDRNTRAVTASWPVTMGKINVAMALDEANHRLFVACRSGQIVVFDTLTGKEQQSLPIAKGVDDMVYDSASKRLYASCDGVIDVYQAIDFDHYQSLGEVTSGPQARTARLVPELNRYFVALPQNGADNAKILIYEVQ